MNGTRINSCPALAIMYDSAEVKPIQGFAEGDLLHPLQQAFIDLAAFQCGYCRPGQVCSAAGMIGEGRAKTFLLPAAIGTVDIEGAPMF